MKFSITKIGRGEKITRNQMKSSAMWDVTASSQINVSGRFG
jgi:hypothetical protein